MWFANSQIVSDGGWWSKLSIWIILRSIGFMTEALHDARDALGLRQAVCVKHAP